MNKANITKELDWFCHHIVSERMMSREDCIRVIEELENNAVSDMFEAFPETAVKLGLANDVAVFAKHRNMAKNEARIFGAPSRSVFAGLDAISSEKKPAAPAASQMAQPLVNNSVPPPLPIKPDVKPAKNDAEWMKGWPDLSAADTLDAVAARKLLIEFLHKARENKCSDIHISAGAMPFVRRNKQVFLLEGQKVLSEAASAALNLAPLSEEQKAHFESHHDLDYGYNVGENDRYRVNVMRQRLGIGGSYRVIDTKIRGIRELGFRQPEVIEKLTAYGQGLILVTGPAGSGKSTTLTALIDHINKTRHDHIITVEDPIESVHQSINCNITQRELNKHTKSFGNALRAALREDPDVIVIGELRDLETIEMAIHSSETGHLVIGTLHTSSAADTMNRILDVFPPGQQGQIRSMVAESLKGVICQQLVENADGSDVVLVAEVMLGTLAVSNLIREGRTHQIESTIQTSRNIGMITMEQSHFELYMSGARTYEQTLPFVKNRDLIRQMQQKEASGLASDTTQSAQTDSDASKKRRWF